MILRALIVSLLFATPALSADVEIVVDRSEKGIELFLSLPAADAQNVLGADLSQLDGLTTGVDFSVLQNGTWTQGDVLWGNVKTEVNGAPVTFEAMSMMVHPADQSLPFFDPIDALTAISVCGVPIPEENPAIEEMHLYAGFIAYPTDGTGTLRLDLGNLSLTQVTIRDFDGDVFQESTLTLDPGAILTLAAPTHPGQMRTILMGIVALSLVTSLGLGAALWRQTKNAPA